MKRLFVLCVFVFFGLFFPFASAHAQGGPESMRVNAGVEGDHRTFTQSTVIELLVSVSCIVSGVDPVSPTEPCLGVDPVTRKLGYADTQNSGLVGFFSGMIGGMYNVPVSTHDYVAYNVSNFGPVESAYAQEQGVGFGALSPVINVWVAFRNVVFVFFVILFTLIGLGIMFRLQLDQRAVMSVQNQLPKIVLVIILVVLSYGIAGFMIDMMYILMYFIFELFASIDGVRLDPSVLQASNPFGAAGSFGGLGVAADASGSVGDIISSIFDGRAGQVIAGLLVGILTSVVASPLGILAPIIGFIGGGLGGAAFSGEVLGLLGTVVAFVIFAVALLIALVRVFFTLLKAFVSILIGAVIAPIWIASSLIPSTPFPVSSWFRFMIGNLLMFPAALAMFLFADVFLQLFGSEEASVPSFPFVGNPNNVDAFGALIAFGIILLIPTVITKVKDAVGIPAGELTTAVTGTVAGGKNVVGGLVGGAVRPYWGSYPGGGRKWLTQQVSNKLQRSTFGRIVASALPGKHDPQKGISDEDGGRS